MIGTPDHLQMTPLFFVSLHFMQLAEYGRTSSDKKKTLVWVYYETCTNAAVTWVHIRMQTPEAQEQFFGFWWKGCNRDHKKLEPSTSSFTSPHNGIPCFLRFPPQSSSEVTAFFVLRIHVGLDLKSQSFGTFGPRPAKPQAEPNGTKRRKTLRKFGHIVVLRCLRPSNCLKKPFQPGRQSKWFG